MERMKRAEHEAGIPKRRLAALLSASLLCSSCIHSQQIPRIEPPLSSRWQGGECGLSGNSLTYFDAFRGERSKISLDVPLSSPQNLICGENHTVIITPRSAVVSLGGDDILSRHEMIGYVSGRFIPANSIEISLRPILEEGGFSNEYVLRDRLCFQARSGRLWTISLSDPFEGWNIF